MHAVDTHVLVRLIARDDAAQASAAERFIEHGAWIPHLALAEAVWVLTSVYRRPPQAIATAIEMLLAHRQLVLQDPEVIRAALEQFRRRPSVGFTDCLILETARRAGHLPLGTFDRSLGAVDGAHRLRTAGR